MNNFSLCLLYSNTTFVKVKFIASTSLINTPKIQIQHLLKLNMYSRISRRCSASRIQIQHLLKLNARKINPYGFYYTIKSINGQGF